MNRLHSHEGGQLIIDMLDKQLRALSISVFLASQPDSSAEAESNLAERFATLKRKGRPRVTGSGGNIAIEDNQIAGSSAVNTNQDNLDRVSLQGGDYLRIVIGNAILAARSILIEHHTAEMRTPEIQFLKHVCDAILNDNLFDIDHGYIPIATFDGLKIDATLNGGLLFGDGVTDGFMEYGDGVALLQWLSQFVRGEQKFVSGGDAG